CATTMPTRAAVWFTATAAVVTLAHIIERRFSRHSPAISNGLAIAAMLCLAALMARAGLWRKDAFGAPYKPHEESLYAWCRQSTPPGTVFAIPPDLPAFRLETGRAVIVDWKCMPLTPADQLEWRRRHERQARRSIRSREDTVLGYASIDVARTASLASEFGCEYVVVDNRIHSGDLSGTPRVFHNDWFAVFQMCE
ncbi:MAG: hypothetical protein O7B26_12175, partial [Planctomycetota bacterium]|nr:hypothetical protein [Planctomycetota bacterium]